jgi:hypothetical protein
MIGIKPRKFVTLMCALATASGCSIPSEYVRADGVVVVEMLQPGLFRIGKTTYTAESLEVAMQLSRASARFQAVDLYVPRDILRAEWHPCQSIAVAMEKSQRPWHYFSWVPGQPETLTPTECEFVVPA